MTSAPRITAGILLLLATGAGASLDAQATGMPTFFAPTRAFGTSEIGVTLSRPGGSATGLEGRFGAALDRADLSFRAGYVDYGGDADGSVVAGVEARVPVLGHSRSFPLDGAFILGVGHRFDDGPTFVPVGLTLGRRLLLDGSALVLTPYLQPTVIFGDDSAFAFGLGLDVGIRGLPEIRLNVSEGDLDGFSVGVFWSR